MQFIYIQAPLAAPSCWQFFRAKNTGVLRSSSSVLDRRDVKDFFEKYSGKKTPHMLEFEPLIHSQIYVDLIIVRIALFQCLFWTLYMINQGIDMYSPQRVECPSTESIIRIADEFITIKLWLDKNVMFSASASRPFLRSAELCRQRGRIPEILLETSEHSRNDSSHTRRSPGVS
jgi:hypothetical protein